MKCIWSCFWKSYILFDHQILGPHLFNQSWLLSIIGIKVNKPMSTHDAASSDNDSEYQRRRIHSLLPPKNQAQAEDSSLHVHHLFNPHSQDQNEIKSNKQMSDTDGSIQKQVRSEGQFQFKTPCDEQKSDAGSNNQISPSIKDFQVETVLRPFSHQSLSKVVQQAEKAIPEEMEDIEKKEPAQELENCDRKVLDFQNLNTNEGNECIEKLNDAYGENIKILGEQRQQIKNQTAPLQNMQAMQAVSEISMMAERSIEDKEFQKEYLETVSVRSLSQKEPASPKQEKQLVQVNQIMKSEILQEQFASKASVYYQNERKNFEKCNHYYEHFSQSANSHKFTFSNIETISVRYTPIQTFDFDQQTERKKLQNSEMSFEKVNPFKNQNIKIGNPTFEQVESKKKCNQIVQTSFQHRLLAISKGYDEKIGIVKEVIESGQQSAVELFNAQIQTQGEPKKKKGFSFCEQVNFVVSFDHEQKLCNQIIGFEKYLKQMNEERKKQLLEERAKKSMCKQTNTQNCMENEVPAKKNSKNSKSIHCKSFACQYDEKDIGPRPSIKRSSLVTNKQSKRAPVDNYIIQLTDDDDRIKKRGRRSKKQAQAPKLKIEFGRSNEDMWQPKSEEKVRKSNKVDQKSQKGKSKSKK